MAVVGALGLALVLEEGWGRAAEAVGSLAAKQRRPLEAALPLRPVQRLPGGLRVVLREQRIESNDGHNARDVRVCGNVNNHRSGAATTIVVKIECRLHSRVRGVHAECQRRIRLIIRDELNRNIIASIRRLRSITQTQ